MNDVGAFLLFCTSMIAVTFGTLWIREMGRRKRIENYLRGVAAGQGLAAPDITGDLPYVPMGKQRGEGGRIDQLEIQMDQMSQQLERLVESQEFLSRVMADRNDRLADPRMRTPH